MEVPRHRRRGRGMEAPRDSPRASARRRVSAPRTSVEGAEIGASNTRPSPPLSVQAPASCHRALQCHVASSYAAARLALQHSAAARSSIKPPSRSPMLCRRALQQSCRSAFQHQAAAPRFYAAARLQLHYAAAHSSIKPPSRSPTPRAPASTRRRALLCRCAL